MIMGLDIGGTTIKGGLVTKRGVVTKRASIPSNARRGQARFVENIERCIELLGVENVDGIGVGCPGSMNPSRGIIIAPPNIPLRNFPLREYLARRYHLPVTVDNDANAFTLAEATLGAGKRYRSVVGLTLGTGIGGGIIIDKTIEHGRGNAGELGYITLHMHGPRGKSGDVGSLQEYLRGEPLEKVKRALGLSRYSAKDLEMLGRQRKRIALAYWKRFGEYLGIGIASIVHVLDPDIIVLGGSIARAFSLFREELTTTVRHRTVFPPPPIRRAALGNDAGIIGAALLTQKILSTKS
ncbi:ROK family protein [Candidatus Uhrbacteria bacterium]|nr:ROK family protein [Candidatus Uhrbacteria bacterium]